MCCAPDVCGRGVGCTGVTISRDVIIPRDVITARLYSISERRVLPPRIPLRAASGPGLIQSEHRSSHSQPIRTQRAKTTSQPAARTQQPTTGQRGEAKQPIQATSTIQIANPQLAAAIQNWKPGTKETKQPGKLCSKPVIGASCAPKPKPEEDLCGSQETANHKSVQRFPLNSNQFYQVLEHSCIVETENVFRVLTCLNCAGTIVNSHSKI